MSSQDKTRRICVVQDFLTEKHKTQIQETAENLNFKVWFYTSQEKEEAKKRVQDCEILYAQSPDVLKAASENLKWYAASSAGVDVYCKDPALFANPACLLTSANVYGVTIAEHVIMTALMLLRRMPDYDIYTRKAQWPPQPLPVRSIRDGVFTILGTGNIGTNIADRLHGMGAAQVIGLSKSGRGNLSFDAVYPIDKLDEFLPKTEFLIMALPATPDTVEILNQRRIALLPESAYIINIGRGNAIEQDALINALNTNQIAGAALDVMTPEPLPSDSPLWTAKNLVLTPHVAGNMTLGYTADANVNLFCENLNRYANGEKLKCLIDRTRGY